MEFLFKGSIENISSYQTFKLSNSKASNYKFISPQVCSCENKSSQYIATHAAISLPLEQPQIEAIAER